MGQAIFGLPDGDLVPPRASAQYCSLHGDRPVLRRSSVSQLGRGRTSVAPRGTSSQRPHGPWQETSEDSSAHRRTAPDGNACISLLTHLCRSELRTLGKWDQIRTPAIEWKGTSGTAGPHVSLISKAGTGLPELRPLTGLSDAARMERTDAQCSTALTAVTATRIHTMRIAANALPGLA